jgi:hypothetical protein
MNPRQDLHRLFSRTGYRPLLTTTGGIIQKVILLPAVGLDHYAHGGRPGLILRGFHRYHHFGLSRRPTAALPGFVSTEVRAGKITRVAA